MKTFESSTAIFKTTQIKRDESDFQIRYSVPPKTFSNKKVKKMYPTNWPKD